jgi:siroheme synthase (precorrin-2 oxidase/ferrochelatase)
LIIIQNVSLKLKSFDETDLDEVDFVVAATNNREIMPKLKTCQR